MLNLKKGLITILASLFLFHFASIYIKGKLSSEKINRKIQSLLIENSLAEKIKVLSGKINLHEGVFPGVFINLEKISFRQVGEQLCGQNLDFFEISNIKIPVLLFSSLFEKKIVFGSIVVDDIVVNIKNNCSDAKNSLIKKGSPEKVAVLTQKKTRLLAKRKKISLNESKVKAKLKIFFDNLDAVNFSDLLVNKINVIYNNNIIKIGYIKLDRRTKWYKVKVAANHTVNNILNLKYRGSGRLSRESLELSHLFMINEGRVQIYSEVNQHKFTYKLKVNIENLPMYGFVKPKIKTNVSWLWMKGVVDSEGSLSNLNNQNLNVEKINIYGDSGSLVFSKGALNLVDARVSKPIIVKINNFSVKKFTSLFGEPGLSGILKDFGKLDGHGVISSKDKMSLNWVLKGSKIKFSNFNRKAIQKIDLIKGFTKKTKNFVRGKFTELVLNSQTISKPVDFVFNENFNNGSININIDKIRLSPSVQKILVGGELGPVMIKSKIRVEKSKVTDSSMSLAVEKLENNSFKIEAFKLVALKKKNVVTYNASAKMLTAIKRDDKFYNFASFVFGKEIFDSLNDVNIFSKNKDQNNYKVTYKRKGQSSTIVGSFDNSEFSGELSSNKLSQKAKVHVNKNKEITIVDRESGQSYQFDIDDMIDSGEIFKIKKIKQLGEKVLKKVKNIVPSSR